MAAHAGLWFRHLRCDCPEPGSAPGSYRVWVYLITLHGPHLTRLDGWLDVVSISAPNRIQYRARRNTVTPAQTVALAVAVSEINRALSVILSIGRRHWHPWRGVVMTTRHMWRRWLAASWPRDLVIGDVSALEDARATRKSFDVVRPRRHGRDFEADIVWRRNGWPCTHMDIPGHWSVLYLLQRLLSTKKNCPPIYTGFCLFLSVSMKNNCARFIRNKKYTTFFLGSSPPLLRLTLSLYW